MANVSTESSYSTVGTLLAIGTWQSSSSKSESNEPLFLYPLNGEIGQNLAILIFIKIITLVKQPQKPNTHIAV